MLQPQTLTFLSRLKENNNKPWFDTHKKRYDEARISFIEVVDTIIPAIAKFDPEIGNLIAKECVFRINRDVRFSKNKQPYKNNMAAYFNRAGKKGTGAGYYLHIEPGKSFAAAGIWMPLPEDLLKIRQEIDYNFNEWKKIIGSASFKNQFENGIDKSNSLVRPPKGYEPDNAAIEFIKLKSFVTTKPLPEVDLINKNFVADLSKTFKAVKPLIDFINRALD